MLQLLLTCENNWAFALVLTNKTFPCFYLTFVETRVERTGWGERQRAD